MTHRPKAIGGGELVKFPAGESALLAGEIETERQKYRHLSAEYVDVCRDLEKTKADLAARSRDIAQMRRGEIKRLKVERDSARADLRAVAENSEALALAVAQLARGLMVLSNNKREIMDAIGLAMPEEAVRLALGMSAEDFILWSATVDEISRNGLARFRAG